MTEDELEPASDALDELREETREHTFFRLADCELCTHHSLADRCPYVHARRPRPGQQR